MAKIFTKCPYCGADLTDGNLYFEGISGLGNAPAYVWGVFEDESAKNVKQGFFGRNRKKKEKVSEEALSAAKCDHCERYFAVFEKK